MPVIATKVMIEHLLTSYDKLKPSSGAELAPALSRRQAHLPVAEGVHVHVVGYRSRGSGSTPAREFRPPACGVAKRV